MLIVVLPFGLVALFGLVAAVRPNEFCRYFLADFQREKIAGNMDAISRVGWAIFACSALVVIVSVIRFWGV
jgi:hypothetical protein